MCSDKTAIRIQNVSKQFALYSSPRDRLKQFILPRLQAKLGKPVKQYFQTFQALNDISFSLNKGETVGIVGHNGSGKSTLLQIICGTLNATTGSVETNGRIAALLELGSGFNSEFSGLENIYMNAMIFGLSKNEIDERLDKIIAFADIGQFIERPVKTYSSGMMMRLAFAVAINVDPQILIIDEALSVGDELFQRKCFAKIQAIKESGATILFVSHSGSAIIELCDRALLLNSGELLLAGSPKLVVNKYQRLLHVADEQRQQMLDELRTENENTHQEINSENLEEASQTPAIKEIDAYDFFDANLKSQSLLEYPSSGAVIKDVQILGLDLTPLNVIKRGQEYLYRYTVRFDEDAIKVRAGTALKTVSGLELGSMQSHSFDKRIPHVKAGTTLQVTFRFKCTLLEGIYFLNAGIAASVDDSEIFLHRIVDVCTFRVVNESQLCRTGIVDFGSADNLLETAEIISIDS